MLRTALLLSLLAAAIATSAASARDDIRVERVHFERGASSAVVQGSITGYETVDYVLGAQKGQSANISMGTDNSANYFNILAPGENEAALFNGSAGENQYEGVLPQDGDYKIRVYLMRSAARRNEKADYRLEMVVTGAGSEAGKAHGGASPDDAQVAGTSYHATGNVPCSMGGGQPTGSCAFGVTRAGGASAMVTVTKPDRRTRVIFFENGRATGYDESQADPGEFRASREGDVTIVQIGAERYEIPDAVVSGG
jgi:hypothetical protein